MIPVSIVTGFLGSGKTTLIRRILADPGFRQTAVIVNEFGEIGLDHEIIAASDERLVALTTGCLCCAVRSDLVATLLELSARRRAGEITYQRVLIETSGLADPAPIMHALMTDPDVGRAHVLDRVVAVVDAVLGEATLLAHVEARRQAAMADTLMLSKTDVSMAGSSLLERLRALNATAELRASSDVTASDVFSGADPALRAERFTRLPQQAVSARHSESIETFTLERAEPLPALVLTLLLQALAEHCGARLLRMKGLVAIAEMPGRPALVHGVQHVFSPPEFLDRWPSDDETTRMVFIARGVPRHFPARLLDVIESEVREEIRRATPPRR